MSESVSLGPGLFPQGLALDSSLVPGQGQFRLTPGVLDGDITGRDVIELVGANPNFFSSALGDHVQGADASAGQMQDFLSSKEGQELLQQLLKLIEQLVAMLEGKEAAGKSDAAVGEEGTTGAEQPEEEQQLDAMDPANQLLNDLIALLGRILHKELDAAAGLTAQRAQQGVF